MVEDFSELCVRVRSFETLFDRLKGSHAAAISCTKALEAKFAIVDAAIPKPSGKASV